MRYAHVRNGIVENVSVWDHEPTAVERARYAEELINVTDVPCGPDWTYANGSFAPPAQSE